VLDHQYEAPGRPYHGTFRRSPDEPQPPAEPKLWSDYDPNWREFVGTTLTLALLEYEARLPPGLVERIDASLRRATEGALERGVLPSYSNIALMSAFLQAFAGERLGEPAWVADGERLGSEVVARFRAAGAFDEYNSPTYYGVDLYALALWRVHGTEPLRAWGAELEAALWRDIARRYHAGMRNLAGPYDRSYGMDMQTYLAPLGLWLWLAVGHDRAPLPEAAGTFAQAWDFGFGPLFALIGVRVPDDALAHFEAFQGERTVEQLVAPQPRRVATAWLAERVMLGAEDAGGRRRSRQQYHGATIHWLGPADGLGWIRLRSDVPVDAHAGPHRLVLAPPPREAEVTLIFELHAPTVDLAGLDAGAWALPGLAVAVDAPGATFAVERRGALVELRYTARTPARVVLTLGGFVHEERVVSGVALE
jgi:hypothetical protein